MYYFFVLFNFAEAEKGLHLIKTLLKDQFHLEALGEISTISQAGILPVLEEMERVHLIVAHLCFGQNTILQKDHRHLLWPVLFLKVIN